MIPKIIHQIYFDMTGLGLQSFPMFVESQQICKTYTDYEYMFWDEAACQKLINEHYPEYVDFYNGFRFEIQKIDFVRFCILHRYGGFYIDMDMYILRDLTPLTEKRHVFHNVRYVQKNYAFIENDFIGSEPESILWLKVMEDCVTNYEEKASVDIYNKWKGRFVLQTTGPKFLSRAVKKYIPKYKPMRLAHTKWSKDSDVGYYIRDHKANTWVNYQKRANNDK